MAFYHPKRDGCTVIMISKASVAARWRSHLQKAMEIKGLVHISENVRGPMSGSMPGHFLPK